MNRLSSPVLGKRLSISFFFIFWQFYLWRIYSLQLKFDTVYVVCRFNFSDCLLVPSRMIKNNLYILASGKGIRKKLFRIYCCFVCPNFTRWWMSAYEITCPYLCSKFGVCFIPFIRLIVIILSAIAFLWIFYKRFQSPLSHQVLSAKCLLLTVTRPTLTFQLFVSISNQWY